MQRDIINAMPPKMDKALEHLEMELRALRTGRASTALVDGLLIEAYGNTQPLKAMATLNTPDAVTIAITPWDKSLLPVIEKVIRETQSLGLNPTNDGSIIRLGIPPMSEERRRDLTKVVGQKAEEARITLRNLRHEGLAEVKKLEREKQATQDDVKWAEAELNKLIEQYQAKVEAIAKAKEQEIMEV